MMKLGLHEGVCGAHRSRCIKGFKKCICKGCGRPYEIARARIPYCPRCKKIYNQVYGEIRRKIVSGRLSREDKEGAFNKELEERFKELDVAHESAVRSIALSLDPSARCKRCGSRNTVNVEGFCIDCVEKGLDHVFKVRKLTTGWDCVRSPNQVYADEKAT